MSAGGERMGWPHSKRTVGQVEDAPEVAAKEGIGRASSIREQVRGDASRKHQPRRGSGCDACRPRWEPPCQKRCMRRQRQRKARRRPSCAYDRDGGIVGRIGCLGGRCPKDTWRVRQTSASRPHKPAWAQRRRPVPQRHVATQVGAAQDGGRGTQRQPGAGIGADDGCGDGQRRKAVSPLVREQGDDQLRGGWQGGCVSAA